MENLFGWGIGGFLTGLREGVEAALIVGIIAGYLVKIGRADRLGVIWAGVLSAIAASAAIGIGAFVFLGGLQGDAEKLIEGFASLLAVVFLTYMIFWTVNVNFHNWLKQLWTGFWYRLTESAFCSDFKCNCRGVNGMERTVVQVNYNVQYGEACQGAGAHH